MVYMLVVSVFSGWRCILESLIDLVSAAVRRIPPKPFFSHSSLRFRH